MPDRSAADRSTPVSPLATPQGEGDLIVSGDCERCKRFRRPHQFHPRTLCPFNQPLLLTVDWNAAGRLSARHDSQHACHVRIEGLDAMPRVGQTALLTDGEMACFGVVVATGEGEYSDWFWVDETSDLTHNEAHNIGDAGARSATGDEVGQASRPVPSPSEGGK